MRSFPVLRVIETLLNFDVELGRVSVVVFDDGSRESDILDDEGDNDDDGGDNDNEDDDGAER